jgi:aryl-alcohol dehydrogenase-like predicted oxidoreductase
MEYRTLGRSGLKVSTICLGTMLCGGDTSEDEAARIFHRALDAGINFIDTANTYTKTASETIVGKLLKSSGKRDDLIVATKMTNATGPGVNDKGYARWHVMRECERSLRRLQVDHIDIYYLHRMDLDTAIEEPLRALDDLVRAGKIRYPACSKFPPSLMVECLMRCEQNGWAKFVCDQSPYNIADRSLENELLWACRRFGLGQVPWGPVAQGLLSGKYVADAPPPLNSRWKGDPRSMAAQRFTPASIAVADKLKPLASERGVTLAEFALAWVMHQPAVTSPILGPRTLAQLESGLKALDVKITDEDRRRVDAVVPPGRAVANFYDMNFAKPLRKDLGLNEPPASA